MKNTKLLIILVTLIFVISLASCAGKAETGSSDPEEVQAEKETSSDEGTPADNEEEPVSKEIIIPSEYAEYLLLYRDVLNVFYNACYTDKYTDNSSEFIESLTGAVGAVDEDTEYIFRNSATYVKRVCETGPENTGYMFRDLNGDGTPELIIGSTWSGESKYDFMSGTEEVYMVFSYKDAVPVFSAGSWDRNHNWLLDSDELYFYGYWSTYTQLELFRISEADGSKVCEDIWICNHLPLAGFYDEDGELHQDECHVFHTQTIEPGEDYYSSESKYRIDMSAEEFEELAKGLVKRTVHLDLIPFTQLEWTGDKPEEIQ